MASPHPVSIILVVSFVTGVIGDPPKSSEAFAIPEYPVDDQCKRNYFIEPGKVADYFKQLEPDLDKQSVLDTLGYAVTDAIRLCTKKDILFDDIEVKNLKSYICCGSGKIVNIKSMSAKSAIHLGDKGLDQGSNGPLEFKITFQFSDGISIGFHKSYVNLPLVHDIKGTFYYELKDIEMDITVTTDSYITLLDRLKKRQCFLHVTGFEASIPYATYSTGILDHKRTYNLNKEKISDMLKSKVDEIKEGVTSKVKAAFYEALVNSGEWVCLDDDVKQIINKKLTSTRKTITSEKFKTYCTDS